MEKTVCEMKRPEKCVEQVTNCNYMYSNDVILINSNHILIL